MRGRRPLRWFVLAALPLAAVSCKTRPPLETLTFDGAEYVRETLPPESTPPPTTGPEVAAWGRRRPLGFAANELRTDPVGEERALHEDAVPVTDRWRIGFPTWDRGTDSDAAYDQGAWWDPYNQNILKGDYPLPGTQNTFLNLEVQSLTLLEARRAPTPTSVFPRGGGPGKRDFFGDSDQTLFDQRFFVTADLFQGETAFKPVDYRLFVQAAFDWNYATADENQALFADPSRGTDRSDQHAALQQAFFETTIASVSDTYDVIQLRVGTQRFNADFKGFLMFDDALGARLFGSLDDNRWQWNLGWFRRWDKDTNSGLNTFDSIKQRVLLANVYRQDVLAMLFPRWKSASWTRGLTTQFTFASFVDDNSVHYDENDFLVRPRLVGTVKPTENRINYVGWNNDGHIGRLNVVSSLYGAWGDVDFDPIAGSEQDVRATMAALELSVDVDWMRFRTFGFYQSGDDDLTDDDAGGFDAIYDNPAFAGGEFGFWNRNTIRLTGSGVGLTQRASLMNTLRSSKDQGQPAYVNPGLLLGGVGFDAQVTPQLKLVTNASYLTFDHTDSLEYVLNQDTIGEEIGYDLSMGVIWRPLLTDNVIVKAGVSTLIPSSGFRDVFESETLYAAFGELILTW